MGVDRFSRHRALLTNKGLDALGGKRVAVCGAGGLGSTVLTLLARTGVGEIHIYDRGILDIPDLNRQLLYSSHDLGKTKAIRAAEVLSERRALRVEAHPVDIDSTTEFAGYDLVVDCLDNFRTRFLVDDATYANEVPLVHAGVYRYFGQVTSIRQGLTRSLRELFGESATNLDAEQGKPMFPAAVVTVAALEAAEAIRVLLPEHLQPTGGIRLIGKLLTIDLLSYETEVMPFV